MKVYDAVVTVKARISSVCNDEDLVGGLTFQDLVKDLIDSEGLVGLTDDVKVVHIEQEEREE